MDIDFGYDQKDKPSIRKTILGLCSRWGGIDNFELKNTLCMCDQRVCSEVFKELRTTGVIRRVYYLTQQEHRWIVSDGQSNVQT